MQLLPRLEGRLSNLWTTHNRPYFRQYEKNNRLQLSFAMVLGQRRKEMAMYSASSICCPMPRLADAHQAHRQIMEMQSTLRRVRIQRGLQIAHCHGHHNLQASAISSIRSSQHPASGSERMTRSAHPAARRSCLRHHHSYEGFRTRWHRSMKKRATRCCHHAG